MQICGNLRPGSKFTELGSNAASIASFFCPSGGPVEVGGGHWQEWEYLEPEKPAHLLDEATDPE